MAKIRATADVLCEFSGAIEAVVEYFREREQVVGLELPLRSLGLPTALRIRRNVVVEATVVPDETDPRPRKHDALRISWQPTDGVPFLFPMVDGFVRLRPADGSHAVMSLDLTYQPRFGAAGKLFDAIVGRRIALETASTLLADVKRSMEIRDLAWRDSLAFAGYEANLRNGAIRSPGVPLHGALSVRRHGNYVACHVLLDGSVEEAFVEKLMAGDHFFDRRRALKLLCDVAELSGN